MLRKNIKRPRPNSRKKRRARYLKELAAKKFSNLRDQLILPANDPRDQIADMAFGLGDLEQVVPSVFQETPADTNREFVVVPPPTQDQIDYVAEQIKWREESYDPNQVIGGPDLSQEPIVLSAKDGEAFLNMINSEEGPSPALQQLANEYKEDVASGKIVSEPDPEGVRVLVQQLERLDGSDTRLLDELRAGGHPIAAEDAEGNLVIEETKKEDAAGVAGDTP